MCLMNMSVTINTMLYLNLTDDSAIFSDYRLAALPLLRQLNLIQPNLTGG